MKFRLETLLIAVFMIGSVSLFTWFSISKPHILVLHSYDEKYSWVGDINVGLKRVLDKRSEYSVRWYYMDTMRHHTPEFMEKVGMAVRHMIDKAPPDIIIAVDDEAQQYVTRYYLDHPGIKIVFAGVVKEPQDYGFDHASNVTGILEREPLDALKETLLIAAQRNGIKLPLRIQIIGDRSEPVMVTEKFSRNYNWAPLLLQDSKLVNTYDEWQQAVLESAGKTDFLITSNYRTIARSKSDPTLVPASELVDWTESHSKAPVIGTNEFFAEDGGMLAIGISPYEQGEVAARLASEIIDHGITPNRLPITISHQFTVAMHGPAIRKRHFDLPQIYEAAARAGNEYSELPHQKDE